LLKKPLKWLNPKKKHIKGLYEPNSDASKRLLVKQKTIRVLLNTQEEQGKKETLALGFNSPNSI
jgi:hypothetical protein